MIDPAIEMPLSGASCCVWVRVASDDIGSAQSVVERSPRRGRDTRPCDERHRVVTHLLHRLLHCSHEAIVVETRREFFELGLDEGEADRVLDQLRLRVVPEAFFAYERLHACDSARRDAGRWQDVRDDLGMDLFERPAPSQVADPPFGIAGSRDGPAVHVMGAGRKEHFIARAWIERLEPFGGQHAL
jgi:hypothetical protein